MLRRRVPDAAGRFVRAGLLLTTPGPSPFVGDGPPVTEEWRPHSCTKEREGYDGDAVWAPVGVLACGHDDHV